MRATFFLGLGLLGATALPALASMTAGESLIHRDRSYEEALRYEASADNQVTPAKVIRWLCSMAGHAITTTPSATEFQPIVNVNEGRIRIIAAINYKF